MFINNIVLQLCGAALFLQREWVSHVKVTSNDQWKAMEEVSRKVEGKTGLLLALCHLSVIFQKGCSMEETLDVKPICEHLIHPIHILLLTETWHTEVSGKKP